MVSLYILFLFFDENHILDPVHWINLICGNLTLPRQYTILFFLLIRMIIKCFMARPYLQEILVYSILFVVSNEVL